MISSSSWVPREGLVGLWPPPEDPDVSFSGVPTTSDAASAWVVGLPGDLPLAARCLDEWESRVRAVAGVLPAAGEPFLEMTEAELGSINAMLAPYVLADAEATFAIGTRRSGWWFEACGELIDFLRRAAEAISPTMSVETRVGDRLVARSLLGIGGTAQTCVSTVSEPEQHRLHQATVAVAVLSRATCLRTLSLLASGSIAIAVRLSLPAGPLLALPAAWRLIDRLVREQVRAAGAT